MIDRPPDLDALIDPRVQGRERDRYARVHDLLVRAGLPPELPEALARPPTFGLRRLRIVPPPQ